MSAAENPKLFFPEPKSAMRFFHQHYDKISPKSQGRKKNFLLHHHHGTRFRQTKLHNTNTQSLKKRGRRLRILPSVDFPTAKPKAEKKKNRHKKKESERVAGDPLTFLATVESWKASKSIIPFFRSPDQIHRKSAWSVQRSEGCCRLIERER